MQSLTDANSRQHPDSRIWWVALWEERLDRVDGEGERHNGDRRRPHLEMMMIVMMVVVVMLEVVQNLKAMVKMTTRSSLIAWSSTSLMGSVGLVQTQSQEPG